MSSATQSQQSKVLFKYNNENDLLKAVLNKTSFYYITKKELLINLEKGLYGLAIIDKNIIRYKKEDLKRYTKDPTKFRDLIYQESLKTSINIIINNQLTKNDVKNSLKNTKIKLTEKNTLNQMLKQLSSVKSKFGKTDEEVKKSAYDFYNNTYTEKIDINEKSLYNDIKVLNTFSLYLNVNTNWSADEIDDLAEDLHIDKK